MMGETPTIPKSITEQILDKMLASIEQTEEFDATIMQELKRLANSDNLKKPAQVIKTIKSTSVKKP